MADICDVEGERGRA